MGQMPFFVEGQIIDFSVSYSVAYVKVSNGNIYHVHPDTPGISFERLKRGQRLSLEITTKLTHVLSASTVNK
jgi:hypothetical protein